MVFIENLIVLADIDKHFYKCVVFLTVINSSVSDILT